MRQIQLTEDEEKTLQEGFTHHPKPHFRKKCKALLLSHQGMATKEIIKYTQTRTRTIYTWMDRWQQLGICGLMIKPGRGLKAKLSVEDENLVNLIKKKP